MLESKMIRKTTADLFINNMPVEIFSIEFDSTEMSEEEVGNEMLRRFDKVISIKYHEQWVKP